MTMREKHGEETLVTAGFTEAAQLVISSMFRFLQHIFVYILVPGCLDFATCLLPKEAGAYVGLHE